MTETATTARSGLHTEQFATRRTLVFRRFVRNKPAVVSVIVLAVMFVGCYALPPLLPYSYTDPTTTHCNSRRPSSTGSAPTRWARTSWPKPCAACRNPC